MPKARSSKRLENTKAVAFEQKDVEFPADARGGP